MIPWVKYSLYGIVLTILVFTAFLHKLEAQPVDPDEGPPIPYYDGNILDLGFSQLM